MIQQFQFLIQPNNSNYKLHKKRPFCLLHQLNGLMNLKYWLLFVFLISEKQNKKYFF